VTLSRDHIVSNLCLGKEVKERSNAKSQRCHATSWLAKLTGSLLRNYFLMFSVGLFYDCFLNKKE